MSKVIEICKTLQEQFGLEAEIVGGRYCVYQTSKTGAWNLVGNDGIPKAAYNTKQDAKEKALKLTSDHIQRKHRFDAGTADIFTEALFDEPSEAEHDP
jgi:hypothetical protein